ncbi:MAG: signal peptidase I [Lachnospiraceae bacterium]|nr:signal peptidase I [Lachnospiraceae bacterium]
MDYRDLNQERREISLLHSTVYWIADVVVVLVLAIFVVLFFCDRVTVTGQSMEPTLAASDVVLVNRVEYHFSEPQRFDVIVFEKENNSAVKKYVKRVIGLPGETVQIIEEVVYIDGKPLDGETGLEHVTLAGLASDPIVLGADEYFVLGDNRDSSEDSRFSNIGNVKREEIHGSVWLRVAPFQKFGKISYGAAPEKGE